MGREVVCLTCREVGDLSVGGGGTLGAAGRGSDTAAAMAAHVSQVLLKCRVCWSRLPLHQRRRQQYRKDHNASEIQLGQRDRNSAPVGNQKGSTTAHPGRSSSAVEEQLEGVKPYHETTHRVSTYHASTSLCSKRYSSSRIPALRLSHEFLGSLGQEISRNGALPGSRPGSRLERGPKFLVVGR